MEAEKLDGIKHRPARPYQWMLKNVSLTWKNQVVCAIWILVLSRDGERKAFIA